MATLKLSKDELLSQLAGRTNFKKKDCDVFISQLSEIVLEALGDKKEVTLGSLGTFKYKKSSARICKVIKTGESINVPEKGSASFKTSKKLKDALATVL